MVRSVKLRLALTLLHTHTQTSSHYYTPATVNHQSSTSDPKPSTQVCAEDVPRAQWWFAGFRALGFRVLGLVRRPCCDCPVVIRQECFDFWSYGGVFHPFARSSIGQELHLLVSVCEALLSRFIPVGFHKGGGRRGAGDVSLNPKTLNPKTLKP